MYNTHNLILMIQKNITLTLNRNEGLCVVRKELLPAFSLKIFQSLANSTTAEHNLGF